MISDRDLVTVGREGVPYTFGTMPRSEAQRAIEVRGRSIGDRGRAVLDKRLPWTLTPVPSCRCCGEPAWANLRCSKHQDRNPCVVEGCTRTGKADRGELADGQVICAEHWRRYVPPRSRSRRTYQAHFRRAKRIGWTPETIRSFERFWDALVVRVKERAVDGRATEAALTALADALGVRAADVRLVTGRTSRTKVVEVPDDAVGELERLRDG